MWWFSSTYFIIKKQAFEIFQMPVKNGGQGWIRTTVDSRRQIYSLLPLATRPPTHLLFAFDEIWTRGLSLTKGVRYHCATRAWVTFALSCKTYAQINFRLAQSSQKILNGSYFFRQSATRAWVTFVFLRNWVNWLVFRYFVKWWAGVDSNHRSRETADLQSAPFSHSGTYP